MAAAAKKLEPVQDNDGPAPAVAGPYPEGTELFEYHPRGGGPVILLPNAKSVFGDGRVSRKFIRRLDKLDGWRQTFAWLDLAGVPESIQTLIDDIPDVEYMDMLKDWFDDTGATPGE